ncbi:sensor histidine kinase [Benzoatithermus flavus]|uniref:histidine kinase n=1 Tax=Benzoatithermus flavus TaxID=3108223 RepID=A0ABU8XWB4_9PROT
MIAVEPDPPPPRSEAMQAFEASRRQSGSFVEAVEAICVPMLVTDATLPGAPVIFANPAFLELSGYALDEVLGRGPQLLDGPGTEPETVRARAAALTARRDVTLELLQYRKDGSAFWAAVSACARADATGRVVHHVLSFLDVTRRREAELALQRLNEELERQVSERTRALAAADARLAALGEQNRLLQQEVNHRAKNSLALISSLLVIQARQQTDKGGKAAFLEAQARLGAMAQAYDLLDRSEDGRRVDLARYLEKLCASLPLPDVGGRIRLALDAARGVPIEARTAVSLGLVVNELVTGAVKHAPPTARAATIVVEVQRPAPDRVRLRLRDHGSGMVAAMQEGTLGCRLVHALVQQIEGEIAIESDGGVTVTLSFPI